MPTAEILDTIQHGVLVNSLRQSLQQFYDKQQES